MGHLVGRAYSAVSSRRWCDACRNLPYYFPSIVGPNGDPRALGNGDLMAAVQEALINFVSCRVSSACRLRSGPSSDFHWPTYSEKQEVTILNASKVATASPVARRAGFEVIRSFLRPEPTSL